MLIDLRKPVPKKKIIVPKKVNKPIVVNPDAVKPLRESDKPRNTRKFPHGNDVIILKKDDILKTIDANIIDKDVALAIVNQLSCDIAKNIVEDKWTGIPYIGNVRYNSMAKLIKNHTDIMNDAKSVLSKDEYVVFKRNVLKQTSNEAKLGRVSKYQASMFVREHPKCYRSWIAKGEAYADCKAYFLSNLTACQTDYSYLYAESEK